MGRPNTLETILARTTLTPSGCLEWAGCRNKKGYGGVKYLGRNWQAHRLTWTLRRGEVPSGLQVCHKCDNPPCLNVEHLFLATNVGNSADREAKGRGWQRGGRARGERNPRAKLTARLVWAARLAYSLGVASIGELARAYGVSGTTMHHALSGRTWGHLRTGGAL